MNILPRGDLCRHEWMKKQISLLRRGWVVLDVGCGPQPYRDYCKHLKYMSQDFGEYKGEGTEGLHDEDWKYGKLDFVGDAWNIKTPKESFDAVICTEVLEHVPFPRDTIIEIGRILKPGGVALVTAPINCLPHQNPYFFSHGLSKEFYLDAAKAGGMEVVSFENYSGAVDFLIQETYRILRGGNVGMVMPLLPLLLMRFLRIKGPEYPCFGSLVVMEKGEK